LSPGAPAAPRRTSSAGAPSDVDGITRARRAFFRVDAFFVRKESDTVKKILPLLVFGFIIACAVLTVTANIGCGALGSSTKAAAGSAYDCAKADLTQKLRDDGPSIVLEVGAVLVNEGEGWRDALLGIGQSVGETVLACAVQAAKNEFDKILANVTFGSEDPVAEAVRTASERASTIAGERAWTYKQ
jgi:hypothetical protein